ncbi:Abi family protein [Enterococcus faecalis]|nr:Abi family protein [Enterococcus faecalis]
MEVFFVLKDIKFYSYDEQLILLKEKGLLISDDDIAKQILKNFSYYTIINGYKDLFTDNHIYVPDTRIETLYELHWIDLKLSGILFKYSLIVEKKLKSSVSYLVAKNFGVNELEYLKRKIFFKKLQ